MLYTLSIIHNGLLVAFSGWTFLSLSQILHNDGVVFQSNYYFQNPRFEMPLSNRAKNTLFMYSLGIIEKDVKEDANLIFNGGGTLEFFSINT